MARPAQWLAACMGSRPKDRKINEVNRSKRTLRVKRGPEGGTLRADRGGDSDETPALVAKPSSLRAVQVVATEFNLEAYKTDIKVAHPYEDKKKTLSAAPWDASARRTLDSTACPPSLTKQTIKLNSPEADVKACQCALGTIKQFHAQDSSQPRPHRHGSRLPCC